MFNFFLQKTNLVTDLLWLKNQQNREYKYKGYLDRVYTPNPSSFFLLIFYILL